MYGINRAQSHSGDRKGFTMEVTERQVLKEGWKFMEGRWWLGVQAHWNSMGAILQERKHMAIIGNIQSLVLPV